MKREIENAFYTVFVGQCVPQPPSANSVLFGTFWYRSSGHQGRTQEELAHTTVTHPVTCWCEPYGGI